MEITKWHAPFPDSMIFRAKQEFVAK